MVLYTKSKDGLMRANHTATVRLTREERAQLAVIAKAEGVPLSRLLARCLHDGIACAVSAAIQDGVVKPITQEKGE